MNLKQITLINYAIQEQTEDFASVKVVYRCDIFSYHWSHARTPRVTYRCSCICVGLPLAEDVHGLAFSGAFCYWFCCAEPYMSQ